MPIESLLKRPVETLSPDASCREAAQRMRTCNIGALVVAEEGRPVGIVTDRDLAVRVVADGLDAERVPLRDVMSSAPVYLSGVRTIDQLISVMRDQTIRRVPVVGAEGALEGLVSLDDLLVLLADQLGSMASVIRQELRSEA
jgi:CBS domain-containing protein